MRRALSCTVVLSVVLPVVTLPAVAYAGPTDASGETARTLTVDAAAWSWRRIVPPGQPVGEPSNVPAGGLAVQFDGRPDAPPAKATYLRLALGDLPEGTTALGLTLVLPLGAGQDGTGKPLVACSLPSPFVVGEGVDPATQPTEDCTAAPVGTFDPVGETLAFDLTAQAKTWLAGAPNNGIVVRPDPTVAFPDATPYQLTFTSAKAVTGLLRATLPVTAAVPDEAAPAPVEQPGPVLAPQPGYASGPVVSGPVAAPMPVPAAPAQVPPAVAPVPAVPSAVVPAAAPTVLSRAPFRASQSGLAAGALVGLVLLALVGWSLGDSASPRAFARAERRRRDRLGLGAIVVATQPRQIRQGRKPVSSAVSTLT